MKRICIVFLFSVVSVSLNAQYNLVPNPSFEVYTICPNLGPLFTHTPPWTNALYNTSPDYMNACDSLLSHFYGVPANYTGYEPAYSGVAYAALVTYTNNTINPSTNSYREYIEVELNDSLIGGVDYCIQFYVSACDSNKYISNDIGIYFSPTFILDTCPIGNACNLPYTPQFENPVTNNLNSNSGWTLISGSYTATGGEKFIVVGNFKDSAVTIATYTGWGTGATDIFAIYYIDDILITPCDSLTGFEEQHRNSDVNISSNPSSGLYTIKATNNLIEVQIFNSVGALVYYKNEINSTLDVIDITKQPMGIYFLKTSIKNKFFKFKLLKID